MNLWKMSFSGSILILVIIVVRAVFIHHLPKKTFTLLWEIAILHLILPFSIPSPLSIYSLTAGDLPVWVQDTGLVQKQLSVSQWDMIRCAGTVLCALIFIISYLRCLRKFRLSTPIQDEFLTQWLEWYRIRRPITIRQSDRIITPLTYGILRPVILLPKWTDREDKQQLKYILQHEYIHICRFDTAVKLAAALVLCMYWWNPMVWIMYILFNRDIELVCDECIVRIFGEDIKSFYALTLIHMEENRAGFTPFYSSFSKNAIEERIIAIMKTGKMTLSALLLSCFLVLGISGVFATSAQEMYPNKIYYIFNDAKNYKIILSFDGGKDCYEVSAETGELMPLASKLK